MKKISIALVSVLAAASMTLGACKKAEEKPAEPPAAEPAPAPAPTPEPPKAEPAPAPAEPPAEDKADYVKVEATHAEPKPEDPVVVTFDKFAVTKATIKDTANLEGSTAELEIDLTSLKTDSAKRDAHLNSPDYLETAKFAKATVKIANVKKNGDKTYSADATVSAHGKEKKYPVSFEVVETLPDAVRVKGEQKIELADFKLGKDKEEPVAPVMTVKLQLTLKKT
jgi:polyisoprenoid-binding protein YceI